MVLTLNEIFSAIIKGFRLYGVNTVPVYIATQACSLLSQNTLPFKLFYRYFFRFLFLARIPVTMVTWYSGRSQITKVKVR